MLLADAERRREYVHLYACVSTKRDRKAKSKRNEEIRTRAGVERKAPSMCGERKEVIKKRQRETERRVIE